MSRRGFEYEGSCFSYCFLRKLREDHAHRSHGKSLAPAIDKSHVRSSQEEAKTVLMLNFWE